MGLLTSSVALKQIIKQPAKKVIRYLEHASSNLAKELPLERWPAWLGRLHELNVPHGLKPQPTRSPAGGANINIILNLVKSTLVLPGNIAECGVFRGSTLMALGLYLKQNGVSKTIFGFDSYSGFNEAIEEDLRLGGPDTWGKQIGGFNNTSYEWLIDKSKRLGLDNVNLVKGFFEKTLLRFPNETFCFVHLDCDIYQSYKTCLEYFYPRIVPGGIILLDEYNDPPWPGCTKAVDEFLDDKREKLQEIEMNNYVKYWFKTI